MSYERFCEKAEKVYEMLECEYERLKEKCGLHEKSLLNTLDNDMAELNRRFDAARQGLRLVNKLKPGESKLRHVRRVMSNLSNLRTGILELEKEIDSYVKSQ